MSWTFMWATIIWCRHGRPAARKISSYDQNFDFSRPAEQIGFVLVFCEVNRLRLFIVVSLLITICVSSLLKDEKKTVWRRCGCCRQPYPIKSNTPLRQTAIGTNNKE